MQDYIQAEREKVVVCDNGTGLVKCGFAGDNFPRSVFPCMVGRPVLSFDDQLADQQPLKDLSVGAECSVHKAHLQLSYPMKNGIVQSWDDMRLIWDHAFHEQLKVDPAECKILLTDPALNPLANRQRMLGEMFETYGFSAAFMQVQAVLTLYAQGLLTGLVIDSGDGVSHAVPVVDGYSLNHLSKRLNVAGRHVTSYLVELLKRRGYALNRSADFDSVQRLKERLCYVAHDFEREMRLARETTCLAQSYTLPDGRVIRLGPERFMAPEALFRPQLVDVESPGIAEMAFNCIQEVDIDSRMALYQHIVISGGSTMYPGLPTRLEKELRQLYSERVLQGRQPGAVKLRLKVEDPPGRRHMVFLGGSVLADIMKDRTDFWIRREDWFEDPYRAMKKSGLA